MLGPKSQKGGRGSIQHISPSAVDSVVILFRKTNAHARSANHRLNQDLAVVGIARMSQHCRALSKMSQPLLMFEACDQQVALWRQLLTQAPAYLIDYL